MAAGGSVIVESIAMYEQTRGALDATTDDYGVDLETLRARDPIADFDFQSVAGVIDAYKNLDRVMANQSDLVEIVTELRPLAVVKG